MADVETELPDALVRALPLLRTRPAKPAAPDGYLDLLDGVRVASTNVAQALWFTGIGSTLYDHGQAVARAVLSRWNPPLATVVPCDGICLDVGCGPGNVTAQLGKLVGKKGLALGVDVSVAMLRRAVASAAPNVGFLRADATDLPLLDDTFDAVTCYAVLQLIPDPFAVLDQIARVLRPGGRILIMVPTVRFGPFDRLSRVLGKPGGVRLFGPDELADALADRGFTEIKPTGFGPVQWIDARLLASAA
ncbi:MAG TPA: methyltransferase domain-containing protein [Pseudonocardiaceae bacterium]|jgi:SAM-dependent methyltransferase|nr:methyltransferase domain-containing protein [Pseudonocardiaceae bacterium]